MSKDKIFVQIACYRDPQLVPTLKDCINKAKHPENLIFSIAWQHSVEDTWDNLDEYLGNPQFKIIDINYKDSNGPCWARNLLQQQYNGEKYTLQLDSHHRFIQNWDVELITMFNELVKKGIKKPLLTGYIPSFEPSNDPYGRIEVPWKMNFDRFSPEGVIHFMPASIDDFKERSEPVPARFYSAHFAFTWGAFAKEVQHDPLFYFHGEEISIAVRAYTHGYDLFHPHKVMIWHEYTRKGAKKHWDDDPKWVTKNNECHLRNRVLFGMEDSDIDLGIYGLGTERTLDDYEKYSGIKFKTRMIQQYTKDYNLAPNPVYETEEEYEKSFLNYFKHCIDIGYHQVPYDDYIFWAVAFEDKDGNEIIRLDANPDEINMMKNDIDGYCKLWRSFETNKIPYKWIVWPQSLSNGWCDRLEGII